MAADQRYCLECGERRTPMSSVLLGGPPKSPEPAAPSRAPGPPPQGPRAPESAWQRGGTLTVIAGVGVLLLAMGVGVLIGRSGSSRSSGGPSQVIVATGPSASATPAPAAETPFTDNWPSGTSGYSVQLQTLPQSGTTASAIEAAKTAASAKGAKAVGALKSEDFSSLPAGHYVIYSGVYHKRAEAQKGLAGLKKSFPAASLIRVSSGGSSSSSKGSGSAGGSGGVGSSLTKPAPPTVLPSAGKKGKSYEQESKNLPNVISTG
jgi:hypothetical protein